MPLLDKMLNDLLILDELAGMFVPGAAFPATLAGKLIKVAQAANQAHITATGKPIDPKLLTQEALV